MSDATEIVVIGGGPGGYVAAIRAAQLGKKVTLVEADRLGGICLNQGCIPTKALLKSADLYRMMQHAADFGLEAKSVGFDLKKIVARSRSVSQQLSSGVSHLLKKHKVTVIEGRATLKGKGAVAIALKDGSAKTLQAQHIILATGARARILPGFEPDGEQIWTYREALVPTSLPKSMVVMGSGAIGIEFASFYRTLGVDVTVVELADRILPAEDEEISALAQKSFEKQGIRFLTKTQVLGVKKSKQHVTLELKKADGKTESLQAERLITAVGIVANTENLGLEHTKVVLEKGHVVTDGWLATAEPNLYAIGDVTAGPWLAHKASHEAIVCVNRICGVKDSYQIQRENIPGCTYSHPQIASVGLSEAKAKAAGYTLKIGRFPFMGNGKAIALGEPEGLVKTIFDAKTGELLGAHMIGAEVTEMIQGYVIAKTMEGTEQDLMHTIFPHPTLSEMLHESVLAAFGQAIHI